MLTAWLVPGAGDVFYSVAKFNQKNRENLTADMKGLMASSSNGLVVDVSGGYPESTTTLRCFALMDSLSRLWGERYTYSCLLIRHWSRNEKGSGIYSPRGKTVNHFRLQ